MIRSRRVMGMRDGGDEASPTSMGSRLWRQLAIPSNWPVLAAVAVLAALGILAIGARDPEAARRQMVFLGIGVVLMAAFQAVNYLVIGRYAVAFYILSMLLILYTVGAAAIGGENPLPLVRKLNGTYAWINLRFMSLQPAELMKIAFIMVLARYLRFRSNYRTFRGLLAPFALAVVPLILILKQPDLGTALVFLPTLFAMLFVAGARKRHLLGIVALGLALAPAVWLSGMDRPIFRHMPKLVKEYQRARVLAMFDDDPRTLKEFGFQQHYAAWAFATGGLTGKGLGNIPVGMYVPEAHNDMVFALVGEQFGFVGAAAVLIAYIVLFAAGIEIASSTREPFGRLVAAGVVAMLAGQAFLNLMVATKLMPVTGITLPFVSYGGSSLLASCMAAGLLLNIGQNRPVVMANDSFEFD